MADEQTIAVPHDSLPFRIIMIPDYKPGEGVLVFKINHTLGDGMAIISWMNSCSDNCEATTIPMLKHYPWYLKAACDLLSPITTLYFGLEMILMHKDHNGIANGRKLTGKKNAATCEFDLAPLKNISNQRHCTVNEVVLALLS
jgi:hypothetical protein